MAAALFAVALIIFAAGIVAGVMLVVRAGIKREERDFTLTREAPDRVTRAVRRLNGLYVRDVTRAGPAERETTLV